MMETSDELQELIQAVENWRIHLPLEKRKHGTEIVDDFLTSVFMLETVG